jgi:hypothetical protein
MGIHVALLDEVGGSVAGVLLQAQEVGQVVVGVGMGVEMQMSVF